MLSKDEVLKMARQAGFPFNKYGLLQGDEENEIDADELFITFAELVASAASAKEREACAEICDSVNNYSNPMTANDVADAIRARGQK